MNLKANSNYLVSMADETGFTGKFIGEEDGFLKFETTDTNSTINKGGTPYVLVPALFFVNPAQIIMAKKIYAADECKEYWCVSDNTYDFEKKPTKILLADWQKDNIKDIALYDTAEDCKVAIESK